MSLVRSLRTSLAAVAATLLLAPAVAPAQTFVGSTTGCFVVGLDCTASTFQGLTFTGVTGANFGTTATGALSLANLGTFSLVGTPGADFDGRTFRLTTTFSAPGGSSQFAAALSGTLNRNGNGDVSITFGDAQTVSYTGGSFDLSINDIASINQNGGTPRTLTGSITGSVQSTVPEPATVGLMAAGLIGVAGVGYRRRRA